MKKIVISLFVIFMSGSLLAQSKVGAVRIGARELLTPASVVSYGMGETGVTSTGYDAGFHNPGGVGLFGFESKLALSKYIDDTKLNYGNFYSSQIAVPLQFLDTPKYKLKFMMNFIYNRRNNLYVTGTYFGGTFQPEDTFAIKTQTFNTTFAWGFEARNLDVGFGVALKYYKEDVYGVDSRIFVGDVGVIIRHKLRLPKSSAAFLSKLNINYGLAYANTGITIDYGEGYSDYEMPKTVRGGISLDYALKYNKANIPNWNLFTVLPVIEFEKVKSRLNKWKYGLEFGLFDALKIRTGHITEDEYNSNGLSIHSQGIVKAVIFFSGEKISDQDPVSFFGHRLDMVYSYAVKKYTKFDYIGTSNTNETKYHSLTLLIQL